MLFNLFNSGYSASEFFIIIIAYALSIVIALVVHECAHAWMALKQGDPSAKLAGRLSLNPARHMEPMGLLCFVLVGVGWAKPVPVNPFNYRNYKRGNFWVSISGILANFIIGFICSFGFYMIYIHGDIGNLFVFGTLCFFELCMVINLSLMVFNMLPIPPLDGFNMLSSFTKPNNRFTNFMRQNSMLLLLLLVLFGGYLISGAREFIIDLFLKFWNLIC